MWDKTAKKYTKKKQHCHIKENLCSKLFYHGPRIDLENGNLPRPAKLNSRTA